MSWPAFDLGEAVILCSASGSKMTLTLEKGKATSPFWNSCGHKASCPLPHLLQQQQQQ